MFNRSRLHITVTVIAVAVAAIVLVAWWNRSAADPGSLRRSVAVR